MQQLSTTQCQVGFVNFLAFSPNAMTGSGGRRRPQRRAICSPKQEEALCWQVLLERVRGARVWGASAAQLTHQNSCVGLMMGQ